ncbi:MAG: hypothetical protein R3E79_01665 [Caldilineaceae bacterium]
MNTAPTATSTSAPSEIASQAWPLLPVETEIYILPDGRVVVADLPAELAPLLAALGVTASTEEATPDEARSCHE